MADIRSRLQRRHSEVAATLDSRLRTATSVQDLPADPGTVVIEAVVENLDVKRSVFTLALEQVGEDAILATNTSSLSITEIAARTADPSRVVGMHFFNPVPAMRLVEVVRARHRPGGRGGGRRAGHVLGQGRRPRPVGAGLHRQPGGPAFYGEALRLAEEGAAPPETIDEVLRSAGGFRMGPFELMDLIGNDVNSTVTETVWRAFHFDPRYAPSLMQRELVAAGRLGRKAGRGFYSYRPDDDVQARSPPSLDPGARRRDPPRRVPATSGSAGPRGRRAPPGEPRSVPCLQIGDLGLVVVTRGRTAGHETELAEAPVAVLDRCLDPETVGALALAAEDDELLRAS